MFSKEEHENLLKEIAMTGGDTDNMLKLLQRLRDDFDEREGELRKNDENKDKNDPDDKSEEEKIKRESEDDDRRDGGLRRDPLKGYVSVEEYNNLRKKYIDRFFGGSEAAVDDQEEDVKDDGKKKSFDDLFKDREG